MKRIILILVFFALSSCSSKIVISGIALQSRQFRPVAVIVNDTIKKYADTGQGSIKEFDKLWKKYSVLTDIHGRFTIKVRPTDSLYFYFPYHITQSRLAKDLASQKYVYIKLEEQPCDTVKCRDTNPDLYAMVAKKIKVKREENNNCKNIISLDAKFTATYKVLDTIYGDIKKDTVSFTVYDHHGRPAFEKFDHIVVYLWDMCNELVHAKYQFSPVFATVNGQWAAPYNPLDYKDIDDAFHIKPQIIPFVTPVTFSIKDLPEEYVKTNYPAPYYKIENEKAIAVYGNYASQLFELKNYTIFNKSKNPASSNGSGE